MAFTAGIFEEDYRRLTREFSYSEGGSLYGLWTTSGNPVVRVAFSYSLPKQADVTRQLSLNFKLCHIGEWRPVRAGSCNVPRENLLSKYVGRGSPERFLVLDVKGAQIYPFLYEKQYFKGQGNLERLQGENPFSHVLRNPHTQAALRHDPPSYHQSAMAGQGQRNPGHAQSQSQEIEIKSNQWYSSDSGNENVQYVFQRIQEIAAYGTQVEMSRDTQTHDICMEFTDKLQNKWEVKFPHDFPFGGATLINKGQSAPYHGGARRGQASFGAVPGGPVEQGVSGSATLDEAVNKIIHQTGNTKTRIY